ncbi:DUF2974 domain-containing protein [Lacticaseibacillus rhamnosus]|uniref:DUF2974 domain-containing protein n=1 Tax=Lacticaseibacillus rhamnosus TaxID=47715 RepID=UPI00214CEE05|nr:DUF2974 domain-containing protein [Lacticaseibacillus rhamnosus]UUT37903.1 DUF2974 domain-containing protein [Lacticaseibacillus rhamnosus]
MPSIADYPQRLNLAPFQQTRLTELDAGLFAQLGYLNFNYLIGQPYARFADLNDSSRLNKATLTTWAIPTHQAMLQAMRQSARFARVTWTNWLETCSHRNEEDFGAITFTLALHVYCVSFRGTTNKLVGWKEDLNMSFMPTIPAQRRALSYLTRQISRHPGTYYLTGHSKGGSLAIYAFDNLPQPLADQVAHVYSFDGPSGVPLDPNHRDRVTKLVPQSSLIGVSLDPATNFEVVKSHVKLFSQHDVLTWNIADHAFARLPTTTWISRYFQKTFALWLAGLDTKATAITVDALYTMLRSGNAITLDDLAKTKNHWRHYLHAFHELDKHHRQQLGKSFRCLLGAMAGSLVKTH